MKVISQDLIWVALAVLGLWCIALLMEPVFDFGAVLK